MHILMVYAHPEPRSLNGSLKDFAVKRLEGAGHLVQVSDLYAMKWKASLDADDSLDREDAARFDPALGSKRAFENGGEYQMPELTLRPDLAPGQSGFAAHLGRTSAETT